MLAKINYSNVFKSNSFFVSGLNCKKPYSTHNKICKNSLVSDSYKGLDIVEELENVDPGVQRIIDKFNQIKQKQVKFKRPRFEYKLPNRLKDIDIDYNLEPTLPNMRDLLKSERAAHDKDGYIPRDRAESVLERKQRYVRRQYNRFIKLVKSEPELLLFRKNVESNTFVKMLTSGLRKCEYSKMLFPRDMLIRVKSSKTNLFEMSDNSKSLGVLVIDESRQSPRYGGISFYIPSSPHGIVNFVYEGKKKIENRIGRLRVDMCEHIEKLLKIRFLTELAALPLNMRKLQNPDLFEKSTTTFDDIHKYSIQINSENSSSPSPSSSTSQAADTYEHDNDLLGLELNDSNFQYILDFGYLSSEFMKSVSAFKSSEIESVLLNYDALESELVKNLHAGLSYVPFKLKKQPDFERIPLSNYEYEDICKTESDVIFRNQRVPVYPIDILLGSGMAKIICYILLFNSPFSKVLTEPKELESLNIPTTSTVLGVLSHPLTTASASQLYRLRRFRIGYFNF